MKQKRMKNFIAFTLAEMMIVLLIVTVLSAAILPSIMGRKSTEDISTTAYHWQYDYMYTYGNYYKGIDNFTQVIIGYNLGAQGVDEETRKQNTDLFGKSTLALMRKNQLPYATFGKSDIAFISRNGVNNGKIAADSYGNLVIGRNFGKVSTLEQAQNTYGNLFVGLSTEDETPLNTYGNINNNTVIGVNSLRDSYIEEKNIVIGNDINNVNLGLNNIVIGRNAAYGSLYTGVPNFVASARFNDNIAIGSYANSITTNSNSCVNIGRYAGANGNSGVNTILYRFNNDVNIGLYAGYGSRPKSNNSNSVINLGVYAGAKNSTRAGADPINIGSFAGYQNYRGINVGFYAGYNDNIVGGTSAPYGYSAVNIGRYSMTTGTYSIDIGSQESYVKKELSDYGVNIGYNADSTYPYTTSSSLTTYGGSHGVQPKYANINIGSYAGRGLIYPQVNIYIGSYAGYFPQSDFLSRSAKNIVLGSYATVYGNRNLTSDHYVTGSDNIIIGCSGVTITGYNKMCIGGKYPLSAGQKLTELGNSNVIAWDPTASNPRLSKAHLINGGTPQTQQDELRNNYYETFITTPGILAASNVAWNNTRIILYSKYVIAYSATMKQFSDKTLKENIRKTKYGIEKLRKLAVKEFNMIGSDIPNIGVIAQELMKVYPDAVSEVMNPKDGKNYYTVSPDWIIFSMVQALKDVDIAALDLHKELTENKALLAKETKKVDLLEKRLDKLSSSNKVLQSQLNEIDKMLK